jgi:uncharacterized protein (TIGR00730 family)
MLYVGIYCSASTSINPIYNEGAKELASWLGKNKLTLINGGSSQGLMAIFSQYTKENGGQTIGVIPCTFKTKGWISSFNDETVFVADLWERMEFIKQKSDVLIVFPGGIGSLDEFFDAWASFSLGFHTNKIILVNMNGFYKPILDFIDQLKKEHFLHDFLPNPLIVTQSVQECIDMLESMK